MSVPDQANSDGQTNIPGSTNNLPADDLSRLPGEDRMMKEQLVVQAQKIKNLQEELDRLRTRYTEAYNAALDSPVCQEVISDISNRQETEKSIIRNRALMAAIPDMIFVFDQNGTYIDYRAAAQAPLVVPGDNLLGNKLTELLPPSVSGPAMDCIRQVLETGEMKSLEYTLEINGQPRHFEARMVKMDDSSVISASRDITERKEAEYALRDNERKLSTFMDNLPGMVYYCANDEDWTMEFVSQGSLAFTGYAPRSLINSAEISYNDIIHPDDRQMVYQAVQDGLDRRSYYSMEYRIITRDGNVKFVWEQGKGAFDENDSLTRLEGLIIDVSERKQAEEERDRLQQMLNSIINSMPSILVTVDRNGSVTQWNSEASRKTGFSEDQARGKPIQEVLPLFSGLMDHLDRALADQALQIVERMKYIREGETRYAEVMIYPLISSSFEGAVLRIDDTTEKVLLQDMVIQTEKILSVGGLAAGMAHEINNPLSGILQAVQNIQRRTKPDVAKNQEAAQKCGTTMEAILAYMENRSIFSFIQGIQDSGERAAAIVNKMLEFSRRSTEQPLAVNLSTLVERAVELAANDYDLKKGYDFRHIHIIRDYDPSIGDIPCFPGEIEQVILNLLKNAAHAIADSSPHNDYPEISLLIRRDDGMAVIEVHDNGPGMSEEVLRRVFEPFFTTKAPGIGTGLGLSVSYYIVTNNHKGKMAVSSCPGLGTTVSISLPMKVD